MQTLTQTKTTNGKPGMIVKRVSVPMGLEELMEGLSKEVLLKKPKDLYIFASEYFSRLVNLREKSNKYKAHPVHTIQSVTQLRNNTTIPQSKKISPARPTKHLSRQFSMRSKSPAQHRPTRTEAVAKGNTVTKSNERKRSSDRKDSTGRDSLKTISSRDSSKAFNTKGGTSTGTSSVQSSPREKKQSSVTRKVRSSISDDGNKPEDFRKSQRMQKKSKSEKVKTALISPTVIGGTTAAANVGLSEEVKDIMKENEKNQILDSDVLANATTVSLITNQANDSDLKQHGSEHDKEHYADKIELDGQPKVLHQISPDSSLDSDLLPKSTNVAEVVKNIHSQKDLESVEENNIIAASGTLSSNENEGGPQVNPNGSENEKLEKTETEANEENKLVNQEVKTTEIETLNGRPDITKQKSENINVTSTDINNENVEGIIQSNVKDNDLKLDKIEHENIQNQLPDNVSVKNTAETDINQDMDKNSKVVTDLMLSPRNESGIENLPSDSKLHGENINNLDSKHILKAKLDEDGKNLMVADAEDQISQDKLGINNIILEKDQQDSSENKRNADVSIDTNSDKNSNLVSEQKPDINEIDTQTKNSTESTEIVQDNLNLNISEDKILAGADIDEDKITQESNKTEMANGDISLLKNEKDHYQEGIEDHNGFQNNASHNSEDKQAHEITQNDTEMSLENTNNFSDNSEPETHTNSVTNAPISALPRNETVVTLKTLDCDIEEQNTLQKINNNVTQIDMEEEKTNDSAGIIEHLPANTLGSQLSDLSTKEDHNNFETSGVQLMKKESEEHNISKLDENRQGNKDNLSEETASKDQDKSIEITNSSTERNITDNKVSIKMEPSSNSDDVLIVSIPDNVGKEHINDDGSKGEGHSKTSHDMDNMNMTNSTNDIKQEKNRFFRNDEELVSKEGDETKIKNKNLDGEVSEDQNQEEKINKMLVNASSDNFSETDTPHDVPSLSNDINSKQTEYVKQVKPKLHEENVEDLHETVLNDNQNLARKSELTQKIINNELSKNQPGLIDTPVKQFLNSFMNNEQLNVFKSKEIIRPEKDMHLESKMHEAVVSKEYTDKKEKEEIEEGDDKNISQESKKNSEHAKNTLTFSSVKDLLDFDDHNINKSDGTKMIEQSPLGSQDVKNVQNLEQDRSSTKTPTKDEVTEYNKSEQGLENKHSPETVISNLQDMTDSENGSKEFGHTDDNKKNLIEVKAEEKLSKVNDDAPKTETPISKANLIKEDDNKSTDLTKQHSKEFNEDLSESNNMNTERDDQMKIGSIGIKNSTESFPYVKGTETETEADINSTPNTGNGMGKDQKHTTKDIQNEDVMTKSNGDNVVENIQRNIYPDINLDEEKSRKMELNKINLQQKDSKEISGLPNPENLELSKGDIIVRPNQGKSEKKSELKLTELSQIASSVDIIQNIMSSKISGQKPGVLDKSVSQYINSFLKNEQSHVFQNESSGLRNQENNKSKEEATLDSNKISHDKENTSNKGIEYKSTTTKMQKPLLTKKERSRSHENVLSIDRKLPESTTKNTRMRRVRSVGVIKPGEIEHKSKIPTSARRSAGRRPLLRQLETDSRDIEEKLIIKKELGEVSHSISSKSSKEDHIVPVQSSEDIADKMKNFSGEVETDQIRDDFKKDIIEPLISKDTNKVISKKSSITKEDVLIAKTILKGIEGAEKHIDLIEGKVIPNTKNNKSDSVDMKTEEEQFLDIENLSKKTHEVEKENLVKHDESKILKDPKDFSSEHFVNKEEKMLNNDESPSSTSLDKQDDNTVDPNEESSDIKHCDKIRVTTAENNAHSKIVRGLENEDEPVRDIVKTPDSTAKDKTVPVPEGATIESSDMKESDEIKVTTVENNAQSKIVGLEKEDEPAKDISETPGNTTIDTAVAVSEENTTKDSDMEQIDKTKVETSENNAQLTVIQELENINKPVTDIVHTPDNSAKDQDYPISDKTTNGSSNIKKSDEINIATEENNAQPKIVQKLGKENEPDIAETSDYTAKDKAVQEAEESTTRNNDEIKVVTSENPKMVQEPFKDIAETSDNIAKDKAVPESKETTTESSNENKAIADNDAHSKKADDEPVKDTVETPNYTVKDKDVPDSEEVATESSDQIKVVIAENKTHPEIVQELEKEDEPVKDIVETSDNIAEDKVVLTSEEATTKTSDEIKVVTAENATHPEKVQELENEDELLKDTAETPNNTAKDNDVLDSKKTIAESRDEIKVVTVENKSHPEIVQELEKEDESVKDIAKTLAQTAKDKVNDTVEPPTNRDEIKVVTAENKTHPETVQELEKEDDPGKDIVETSDNTAKDEAVSESEETATESSDENRMITAENKTHPKIVQELENEGETVKDIAETPDQTAKDKTLSESKEAAAESSNLNKLAIAENNTHPKIVQELKAEVEPVKYTLDTPNNTAKDIDMPDSEETTSERSNEIKVVTAENKTHPEIVQELEKGDEPVKNIVETSDNIAKDKTVQDSEETTNKSSDEIKVVTAENKTPPEILQELEKGDETDKVKDTSETPDPTAKDKSEETTTASSNANKIEIAENNAHPKIVQKLKGEDESVNDTVETPNDTAKDTDVSHSEDATTECSDEVNVTTAENKTQPEIVQELEKEDEPIKDIVETSDNTVKGKGVLESEETTTESSDENKVVIAENKIHPTMVQELEMEGEPVKDIAETANQTAKDESVPKSKHTTVESSNKKVAIAENNADPKIVQVLKADIEPVKYTLETSSNTAKDIEVPDSEETTTESSDAIKAVTTENKRHPKIVQELEKEGETVKDILETSSNTAKDKVAPEYEETTIKSSGEDNVATAGNRKHPKIVHELEKEGELVKDIVETSNNAAEDKAVLTSEEAATKNSDEIKVATAENETHAKIVQEFKNEDEPVKGIIETHDNTSNKTVPEYEETTTESNDEINMATTENNAHPNIEQELEKENEPARSISETLDDTVKDKSDEAATTIQKTWRGFQVRKDLGQNIKNDEGLEDVKKQAGTITHQKSKEDTNAAVKIQSLWRGYLTRKMNEKSRKKFGKFNKEKAILKIQAMVRGYLERLKYEKLKNKKITNVINETDHPETDSLTRESENKHEEEHQKHLNGDESRANSANKNKITSDKKEEESIKDKNDGQLLQSSFSENMRELLDNQENNRDNSNTDSLTNDEMTDKNGSFKNFNKSGSILDDNYDTDKKKITPDEKLDKIDTKELDKSKNMNEKYLAHQEEKGDNKSEDNNLKNNIDMKLNENMNKKASEDQEDKAAPKVSMKNDNEEEQSLKIKENVNIRTDNKESINGQKDENKKNYIINEKSSIDQEKNEKEKEEERSMEHIESQENLNDQIKSDDGSNKSIEEAKENSSEKEIVSDENIEKTKKDYTDDNSLIKRVKDREENNENNLTVEDKKSIKQKDCQENLDDDGDNKQTEETVQNGNEGKMSPNEKVEKQFETHLTENVKELPLISQVDINHLNSVEHETEKEEYIKHGDASENLNDGKNMSEDENNKSIEKASENVVNNNAIKESNLANKEKPDFYRANTVLEPDIIKKVVSDLRDNDAERNSNGNLGVSEKDDNNNTHSKDETELESEVRFAVKKILKGNDKNMSSLEIEIEEAVKNIMDNNVETNKFTALDKSDRQPEIENDSKNTVKSVNGDKVKDELPLALAHQKPEDLSKDIDISNHMVNNIGENEPQNILKNDVSEHDTPNEKGQPAEQSTKNSSTPILTAIPNNSSDFKEKEILSKNLKKDRDTSSSEVNADDVSSVDSVDSVITVVPNVNYHTSVKRKDGSSEHNVSINKSLSQDIVKSKDSTGASNKHLVEKSLSADALKGHVDLIDHVQNTLLDQISGKSLNTANKFDIEQLRKELHEAASLYKSEDEDPRFATHDDELLEYLNDFEPEDNNDYDSRVNRTPIRELPDIEEEVDSSTDDNETMRKAALENSSRQEFCKTPSTTGPQKLIDNKPLKDHVELVNVEALKQGHNEIVINNDKIQIKTTENNGAGNNTTDDSNQQLLHTSELHDSVLIPMVSSSVNRSALVHSGKLKHTSEFHDTLVVPLPSGSDINIKNEAKEMLQKDKPVEQKRTESVDTGNQTAFQQSPAGAPIVTSRRSSQDGVDVAEAQASLRDTSPAKPKSVESFTHQSPPQSPRFVEQDMESENNNNKRNNAISNTVSSSGKNMEAEAAVKIQAGFRGYQVRKQLKTKNTSTDKPNQERHQVRRKSSGRRNMKDADLAEKSAVKIQAGVRGFLVRRRQKKQLNSSASA